MAIDFTLGDDALQPQLSLERVKPTLSQYKKEIEVMIEDANSLTVKDDFSMKVGIELGGYAKKIISWIETKRKEYISEPATFVKEVNSFCKIFTDQLLEIERLTKQKISQYQTRIELERRENEKKTQEAARKYQEEINKEAKEKGVEAPVVVTPVIPEEKKIVRTESGVSSYQVKTWKFEIIDPNQIPREYLKPNEQKIRDAVKMGIRSVPGIRIYEENETRFR